MRLKKAHNIVPVVNIDLQTQIFTKWKSVSTVTIIHNLEKRVLEPYGSSHEMKATPTAIQQKDMSKSFSWQIVIVFEKLKL